MKALAIIVSTWVIISSQECHAQNISSRSVTISNCPVLSDICSLDPKYNPVLKGGKDDPSYIRPTCQSPDQSTAAERSFIWTAINQTQGQLQNDLCTLDNIFILKSPGVLPGSWGFYETKAYHTDANKAYIAVSSEDLNTTFSAKQNNNNNVGLGIMNGKHTDDQNNPMSVVPETWGLLYVLAHELGHIKWHKAADSNTAYDKDCPKAVGATWSALGQSRWTEFGAVFGTRDTSGVPQPPTNLSTKQLHDAYTGDFSTALAAANSEEDFVESYALRAVDKACNNKCKFLFEIASGDTVDLMNNGRGNKKLKEKFDCGDNSAK